MRRAAMVLALVPLLAGCAASPVFRVTSLDPRARWMQGQAVVRRDAGGIGWSARFQRNRAGQLVFDVAVRNRSADHIVVDPTGFFFTLATAQGAAEAGAEPTWAARDPEAMLERLDLLDANAEAAGRTQFMLDAVGGALEAVDDLGQAGRRTEAEQRRDDEEDRENREASAIERRERAEQREGLARVRDEWAYGALRRTTLAPGESVAGWIVFDAQPVAKFVDRAYRAAHRRYPSSGLTVPAPSATAQPECVFVLHAPLTPGQPGMAFQVRRL